MQGRMPAQRAFFITPGVVDEARCIEEATREFKKTKKKVWIHHHKFIERCNDECYLAPRKIKKEDETSAAFN